MYDDLFEEMCATLHNCKDNHKLLVKSMEKIIDKAAERDQLRSEGAVPQESLPVRPQAI